MKKLALIFSAALLCAAPARALDADDVAQLLRNGVGETVILNMVQSRPLIRPLSAQEVVSLQSLGASGGLLAQLTSPAAAAAAAPLPAAPVYAAPAPVVVAPPVAVQPPVVYAAPYCPPTYVVPRRAPPRVTFGFSFGHGRSHDWDRRYRYYGRPSFRRYGGWSGRRW